MAGESYPWWLCFVFALLVSLDTVRSAAIGDVELKKYKALVEGQGLYVDTDDVEILTAFNFKQKVYGAKRAWFIEFYNTWCGHCQRFAPIWKALAKDVYRWRDVVSLGVIDCADEDNSPLCRDFEIMGYPTLLYFHENYQPDSGLGDPVPQGLDVGEQRDNLIKKLIEEQREGRGKMFPDLIPFEGVDVEHIVQGDTKVVFLVFEKNDTLYGPAAIMDYHSIPEIVVKYTLANNTALAKKLYMTLFPTIYVTLHDGTSEILIGHLDSRKTISDTIKAYLKTLQISIPAIEGFPKDRIWTENNSSETVSAVLEEDLKVMSERVKTWGDVVIQMDLETALRYSLKREIGSTRNITGEKYTAAKNYINIIAKYFPINPKGKAFFNSLKTKLEDRSWILGADIAAEVKSAEHPERYIFSAPQRWMNCRGSKPIYRGFPCGMWTMFHLLTVTAAKENQDKPDADPTEVLSAMLGYVKHFFGCAECSEHFQDMAATKDMKDVSSLDSAVLWLWMAHNTVNKRLSGDITEDPEHPKYQFPLPERCVNCRNRNDNTWNFTEVLYYLKHVYNSMNIKYMGSDARVIHEGLRAFDVDEWGLFSGGMSGSMCFIIYVFSFLLLAVLIKLFLRRGYRKKMYMHDILGKV